MPVSPDIRRRLLYAKYLLGRAVASRREKGDVGLGVTVLLMHDATEMLMLAVADQLQLPLPKKWNFMDLWSEIGKTGRREPPSRIPMERLNAVRVGLKHKGNLPHPQTVRELLPRVEAFFEDVTTLYFDGLKSSELSLADLVDYSAARDLLREARQAFAAGNRDDAFLRLRLAFDHISRELRKEVPLLPQPRVGRIPRDYLDQPLPDFLNSLAGLAQSEALRLKVIH